MNVCIIHVFGINGKSSIQDTYKYLYVVSKLLNMTTLWLFLLYKAAYKSENKGTQMEDVRHLLFLEDKNKSK